MTTTFKQSGANGILTMQYTAPLATIAAVMDDACHALWDRGMGEHGTEDNPITYAQLTLAQKEAVIDTYTAQVYLGLAKQYKSDLDAQSARAAAELEAKTRYNLGG